MQDSDSAWRSPFGRVLIGSGLIATLVGFALAAGTLNYIKGLANDNRRATTPLELMLSSSDHQQLENGNELIQISGRVINPTDRDLTVPPVHAGLRNKQTQELVHSWTIEPPTTVLAARGSASFKSEIEVPSGGDELTVSFTETNQ